VKVPEPIQDPLGFRDQKKYVDRIREARKTTGEKEAMLVAEGEVGRTPVVAVAHDFSFMAGSMGMYVGNAMIAAAERAVELKRPLVLFSAAGGARMQEGILSLMQMPRTTVAVQMLREAGLPYVVVLTHPTTGGVTASYAMLGDVQIAEPGALICFAGPRVIEQTIREKLPEGFQRAEYLLDHGMLDRVTPRGRLKEEIVAILRMLLREPPAVMADLPAPRPRSRPPPNDLPKRVRPPAGADDPAPPQGHRPDAGPRGAAAGRAGPPGGAGAAGGPCRGDQRQGLDGGDDPRGARGGGGACHVYTSPHLARFHERIRVAGELIGEAELMAVLDRCMAANGEDPITFFEITTAAAFWPSPRRRPTGRCSRSAWAGGWDATNVVERPRLTVITPVDMDHQQYLGDTLEKIAGEKAGSSSAGVPVWWRSSIPRRWR
jgi:acetyl-CoA carboxylase carboxyl transferase subunit beta